MFKQNNINIKILKNDFENKGYCLVKKIFLEKELKLIDLSLKNICFSISKNKKFNKIKNLNSKQFQILFEKIKKRDPSTTGAIYDAMQTSLPLQSLVTSKKISKIICYLLNLKKDYFLINFFRSLRLDLPIKKNHFLSWHQDFMDIRKKNLDYKKGITIWAPLNKVNEKDGTVELCIKSHHKRVGIISRDRINKNSSEYLDIDKNEIRKYNKEIISCNRGDVLFMNMNTIHKSVVGTKNKMRKTIVARYVDINSVGFVAGSLKFTPSIK